MPAPPEPTAIDPPEVQFQKFYDLHNINDGYGIERVEKQRALEAFLSEFSEDWLELYHEWHESSGRPPYIVQKIFQTKAKVDMTGPSGTTEVKSTEADRTSPTPELAVDQYCGKPFLC